MELGSLERCHIVWHWVPVLGVLIVGGLHSQCPLIVKILLHTLTLVTRACAIWRNVPVVELFLLVLTIR